MFLRPAIARVTMAASIPGRLGLSALSRSYASRRIKEEDYAPYRGIDRLPPDPIPFVGAQLYDVKRGASPKDQAPEPVESDTLLQHPMYTPPAKPQTELGRVDPPMHMPVYDQTPGPSQATGSPTSWWYVEFDDRATAPIGDYPRDVPMQWTQLKDPHTYWDKQGRRNYGEVLYDHANFVDFMSSGPQPHPWRYLVATFHVLGTIGLIGFAVYWWDPYKHRWFAEKDYPFDGLRVELGGDPSDPEDKWMAATVYKPIEA
ncbi:hypothetical protein BJ742DRAFT_864919 [Cladochytrium replicatum]|nr:hypothetical protein BJ742DRAFT_864919 [Cladochytrium replicatum]